MNAAQTPILENEIHHENGLNQYLTFMLANEEYGVDILRVQEIKGWDGVTPMPNMPDFILGVINLRGTVVPIVDLRKLFQQESVVFDKTTVVIVVRINSEDETERIMGIVVDAVSEVHNIASTDIKASPDFGGASNTKTIKGLSTQDDKMLIMLDIDVLMNKGVSQALNKIPE